MIRLIVFSLTLVALASPAFAQPPRSYLDVSFIGVNSHQNERIDILTPQRIVEIGLRAVSYPELETARAAQFNMGVRLVRHFGVGVRFAPIKHESNEENDFLGPHLEFEDGFWDVRVLPIEEAAVGFHLGGDVAYFPTRHVGIGAVVSVGRGRVEVINQFEPPIQKVEIDVGHMLCVGGLRFRF